MVGHSWAFGIFAVDVPIREEPKRATSAANGLVGAGEVHPFFYIVPWVIYGVCCLIAGQSQDAYMAFGWTMVVPFLLIAGYVCAGVTVALYRIFF